MEDKLKVKPSEESIRTNEVISKWNAYEAVGSRENPSEAYTTSKVRVRG